MSKIWICYSHIRYIEDFWIVKLDKKFKRKFCSFLNKKESRFATVHTNKFAKYSKISIFWTSSWDNFDFPLIKMSKLII